LKEVHTAKTAVRKRAGQDNHMNCPCHMRLMVMGWDTQKLR